MHSANFFDKCKEKNTELEQKVFAVLETHRGKDNAIIVERIANQVGIDEEGGRTNPVTRTAIRNIIKKMSIPVGSCQAGYYLISSEEELDDYTGNLDGRIRGILNRKRSVRAAYYRWAVA